MGHRTCGIPREDEKPVKGLKQDQKNDKNMKKELGDQRPKKKRII